MLGSDSKLLKVLVSDLFKEHLTNVIKICPFFFRFDPERFNETSRDRSKFWFSPFGVGKRECLVRHFPYAAATIVLVTLLRKFKIHLADGNQHPSSPFGVVTHHKEEIFVRLSPR